MDVIHYCKNNLGASFTYANSTKTLHCNLLDPLVSEPCGGLWAGDGYGNPVTPPNALTHDFTLDSYWGASNTDPAGFHSPVALGKAAAWANCQGPTGACDDSLYMIGCRDNNSTNYNDLLDESGMASIDQNLGWGTTGNQYGGYSMQCTYD